MTEMLINSALSAVNVYRAPSRRETSRLQSASVKGAKDTIIDLYSSRLHLSSKYYRLYIYFLQLTPTFLNVLIYYIFFGNHESAIHIKQKNMTSCILQDVTKITVRLRRTACSQT